jgi:hypothetical protein
LANSSFGRLPVVFGRLSWSALTVATGQQEAGSQCEDAHAQVCEEHDDQHDERAEE